MINFKLNVDIILIIKKICYFVLQIQRHIKKQTTRTEHEYIQYALV